MYIYTCVRMFMFKGYSNMHAHMETSAMVWESLLGSNHQGYYACICLDFSFQGTGDPDRVQYTGTFFPGIWS